jgi:class 3 adenylate cyclase
MARAAIVMAEETLVGASGEERFWAMASLAEAYLIISKVEAALERMRATVAAGAGNLEAVAVFARSFLRTARARGVADIVGAALHRPSVIHYTGHIISPPGAAGRFPAHLEDDVAARIATIVNSRPVEIGYGSLAAGADILFAEAILRRGGRINIQLPFREEDFIAQSVRPAGEGWVDRFRACRAQASSVRFATEDGYLGDDAIYAYTGRLAMGLAVLAARHFLMPVEQIAVWDGGPARGSAGTAIDVETWRSVKREQSILPLAVGGPAHGSAPAKAQSRVPLREARAMLFGDLKGFGSLTDKDMPGFVAGTLATMASAVEMHRDALLFANTWGDGLFLVFRSAGAAASCALDLLEAVDRYAGETAEHAARLRLRLGGHFGPVYELTDPILKCRNFFGAHVTRAARIEPVTPPNCICVSDAFAAAIALEEEDRFVCDYVGETELAKSFGSSRLFLLRRTGSIMRDLFPVQA